MAAPDLASTMSRYLIDRIEASPNIEVLCDTEVVQLFGTPEHGLRGVPGRAPLPLETGVEGLFAVGDRCGSVRRVGAAIGEGAAVVAQLHTFFARGGSTLAGVAVG